MRRRLVSLLLLVACAGPAFAQQPAAPDRFDYYLLSLSWVPAYCQDAAHRGPECDRGLGVALHGLWPQYENGGWPEFCRRVDAVPAPLVERELAFMPNRGLVEHEWEKHGACTAYDAQTYFDAADRAYSMLRFPPALAAPREELAIAARDLRTQIIAANRGLRPDMVALNCAGTQALHEIRVCLAKTLAWRTCGANVGDDCPDMLVIQALRGGGN